MMGWETLYMQSFAQIKEIFETLVVAYISGSKSV